MFEYYTSLKNLNIKNFNINKVTDIEACLVIVHL